ncbi:hypothetical protein CEXT_809631 [Caerostris extrusa]|uniref:Uncharacterized protein n=1 Tax=Caerostris extrusa TaxID=172846 RepID=A0AAV4MC37_CAEEX|nr:hypothetical protein CEXT_809631 [Caerostris extrusa]
MTWAFNGTRFKLYPCGQRHLRQSSISNKGSIPHWFLLCPEEEISKNDSRDMAASIVSFDIIFSIRQVYVLQSSGQNEPARVSSHVDTPHFPSKRNQLLFSASNGGATLVTIPALF